MRLCRTNCAFLSNDGLCVEMMVSGRGRVALGCDEPGNSIFIREGLGKTSRAKTLATFGSRVAARATHNHPNGAGGPPRPATKCEIRASPTTRSCSRAFPTARTRWGP